MATAKPYAVSVIPSEDRPSKTTGGLFCSACAGDHKSTNAVKYCTFCQEYFCEVCLDFHKKLKLTMEHNAFLTDLGSLEKNIKFVTKLGATNRGCLEKEHTSNIQSLRWFHPNVSKHDAELILGKHGMDRRYLACRDESDINSTCITIRNKGDKYKHFQMQFIKNVFIGPVGQMFSTPEEVLSFCLSKCDVSDSSVGDYLPVNYEDTITERWFHRNVTKELAGNQLLRYGRPGSYLLCESRTPGNFTLSIKLDANNVKHTPIKRENGKFVLNTANSPQYETIHDVLDDFWKHKVFIPGLKVDSLHTFSDTRFLARDVGGRIEQLSRDGYIAQVGKVYGDGFTEEYEDLAKVKTIHEPDEGKRAQAQDVSNGDADKGHKQLRIKPGYGKEEIVLGYGGNPAGRRLVTGLILDDNTTQRRYINCRGCTAETEATMWRMLWEENCNVIVLLALTAKGGKINCIPYWPERREKMRIPFQVGDLVIKRNKLGGRQDYYEKRVFDVTYKKGKRKIGKRTVFQFHLTNWPDHGYPRDISCLMELLVDVNKQLMHEQTNNQLAVQCSDDAGSSATLIAIDMIINKIQDKGMLCMIDVQNTVRTIKSKCLRADQTESQYKFIYLAIQYYIDIEKSRLNAIEPRQRTNPPPEIKPPKPPSNQTRYVKKTRDIPDGPSYIHPTH